MSSLDRKHMYVKNMSRSREVWKKLSVAREPDTETGSSPSRMLCFVVQNTGWYQLLNDQWFYPAQLTMNTGIKMLLFARIGSAEHPWTVHHCKE